MRTIDYFTGTLAAAIIVIFGYIVMLQACGPCFDD